MMAKNKKPYAMITTFDGKNEPHLLVKDAGMVPWVFYSDGLPHVICDNKMFVELGVAIKFHQDECEHESDTEGFHHQGVKCLEELKRQFEAGEIPDS